MNFDLMKMGGTLSQGMIRTESFCNFVSIGTYACRFSCRKSHYSDVQFKT